MDDNCYLTKWIRTLSKIVCKGIQSLRVWFSCKERAWHNFFSTPVVSTRISRSTHSIRLKKAFLFFSILLFPAWSLAGELYENYRSVRALGMGNAYAPIVRDADSLFYNPAGLARIEGYTWRIFDLHAGVSQLDSLTTAAQLMNDASGISAFMGQRLWAGLGGKTAIAVPYFAAAYYDSGAFSLDMTNPAFPEMNLRVVNDLGFAGGMGMSLGKGVHLGFAARRITRSGGDLDFGAATLVEFPTDAVSETLAKQGVGYGLDLGLTATMDTPVNPTFSFVWKNIGYTSFSAEAGQTAPPAIRDEMTLGMGLEVESMLVDLRPVLEYKYANRPDIELGRKVHVGLEVALPILNLRGGFHQGYYTLGVGMDLGLLSIDAATYGVELGEYPGQLEDRRYLVELSMELGFNPNFDIFTTSGRSSHRLKQRR